MVWAHASVLWWLKACACNHVLHTTIRCGPKVVSLGRVLDEKRYGHIVATGKTRVQLIQFKHSSQAQVCGWDEHHIGNKALFVLILALSLEQARSGKTVAILVLYRKSLQLLLAVLGKLGEQDSSVANIVAESPESIQGSTACASNRAGRTKWFLAATLWTVKGDGLD